MNNFPKLHNAMWPGVVGKGEGSEPPLGLDAMLDLTAAAEVGGARFDGVDLFLADPHVNVDADDRVLDELVRKVEARGLAIGSVVAPVWPPTGGGSVLGDEAAQNRFLTQTAKACRLGRALGERGVRPAGVVRIDTACSVADWAADPAANTQRIVDLFRRACDLAEEQGELLAIEGEICWGGIHSARRVLDVLQGVNRPDRLGFQADMAHTLLFLLGYNAPEDRFLPAEVAWSDPNAFNDAYRKLTAQLRPWTIDLHVAQNDGAVFGSGSHALTGRHCLPNDPGGKLEIATCAGHWLRDDSGKLTRRLKHICWDGCMFPNAVLTNPATANSILATMVAVREAHGWHETPAPRR